MEEIYFKGGYLCPTGKKFRDKVSETVSLEKKDRVIAEKVFRWVRDNYCWDMNKIKGSEKLLENNSIFATSMDKSNLLVSLLRSVGIGCRFKLIETVFYNEYKDRYDDSIHAPVEVYLDGEWVVADPCFGKHTEGFKEVSAFGEPTWEEIKSEKVLSELSRYFVFLYNYFFRFAHPTVRKIRKEIREVREV